MSDKLRRRPHYREVGKVSEFYPKEVVEESKAYYEALRQRIASRAERFTPAQLEMIEGVRILHGQAARSRMKAPPPNSVR
jgi:hypothetical protein